MSLQDETHTNAWNHPKLALSCLFLNVILSKGQQMTISCSVFQILISSDQQKLTTGGRFIKLFQKASWELFISAGQHGASLVSNCPVAASVNTTILIFTVTVLMIRFSPHKLIHDTMTTKEKCSVHKGAWLHFHKQHSWQLNGREGMMSWFSCFIKGHSAT